MGMCEITTNIRFVWRLYEFLTCNVHEEAMNWWIECTEET